MLFLFIVKYSTSLQLLGPHSQDVFRGGAEMCYISAGPDLKTGNLFARLVSNAPLAETFEKYKSSAWLARVFPFLEASGKMRCVPSA